MSPMPEREVVNDVRQFLVQIALELEESAAGAAAAAGALPDRAAAWPQVQRMYTRLQQANYLVERVQKTVSQAITGRG